MATTHGEGEITMTSKISKLMYYIYILSVLLFIPGLSIASTQGDTPQSNTDKIANSSVLLTKNASSSHLNSHPEFWGLGAALIGFVVLSRRRGI